ncbi:MAG: DEAD/DEAH box helicase family protein, partial [Proteobacteria bacterium]|nr:DEAD/DEAH box helicase family protein [Pseudomonadota bacterium]
MRNIGCIAHVEYRGSVAMSLIAFETLLAKLRELAETPRDQGTMFEKVIGNWFAKNPQYNCDAKDVWLWSEWEHAPSRQDTGIDIVVRDKSTGEYWAVQCKFYKSDTRISQDDVTSFITASGKTFATKDGTFQFAHRYIVSTSDNWSSNAEHAITNQAIPVSIIGLNDLAESAIDWESLDPKRPDELQTRPVNELYSHQQEAIDVVTSGFKKHDRGKLIMACGTGKTFTALRLVEQQVSANGLVLFLAPSITLISQSLREWSSQAKSPIHAFVVCSDTKAGRNDEDMPVRYLAYPATTDSKKLATAIKVTQSDRRRVIFSTYQSIDVITQAQKLGIGKFDLVICDEAHRTAGVTLSDEDESDFQKIHEDKYVQAKKRLYMTATPRIYGEATKKKAATKRASLASMDDESIFGPEFHYLKFGDAVEKGLLSDYRVLIVAMQDGEMADVANNHNKAYKLNDNDKEAVSMVFASKIIGSWKGLSKQGVKLISEDGTETEDFTEDPAPMRRAVAFSRRIADSVNLKKVLGSMTSDYADRYDDPDESNRLLDCEVRHVDGTMHALRRATDIEWLRGDNRNERECRILSNARCLSEGIDVPALDAVIFFDTRDSMVDIVQAVGRVMRKTADKKYGYVILPVCMPSADVADYNKKINDDPQFKGIWKVIKSLRAHDESLVSEAEFRSKIKIISPPPPPP